MFDIIDAQCNREV